MAVPSLTVHINDSAVQGALDKMAEAYGPRNSKRPVQNVVRKALRKSLPVLKANAPVDEGNLRDSARVRVSLSRDGDTIIGRLGFVAPRGTGRAAALLGSEIGIDERPPFGRAIEKTFASESSKIASYVETNLAPEIETQFERFAAQSKRGTLRVR